MHDLKAIRQDRGAFENALAKRNGDFGAQVDAVLKLDEQRRAHVQKLQDAQARRNAASKEIGKAKASGDEAAAKKVMDEVTSLKSFIQSGEEEERKLDAEINAILLGIPNLPLDDVPVGKDESANKLIRDWGKPAKLGFKPKQHFEIGEALGLMDFETAAKISGARFVILKGALARLE
ncbi:MAG: serine--tRNA ligase, partial [Pseudomonadota bacterium]|nr:serine--tRNA ligase [Pseudomonadota bacterium]